MANGLDRERYPCCTRASLFNGGAGQSRALVTPSEPKASPPLGEPWTCADDRPAEKLDRRSLFEVTRPPPWD